MNFRNSTFAHVRERHDHLTITAVTVYGDSVSSYRSNIPGIRPVGHALLLTEWIAKNGCKREGDSHAPTLYVYFDGNPAMDTASFLELFRSCNMTPFSIGPIRQPDLVAGLLQRDTTIATKKTVLRELNEAQLVCQLMIAFYECERVLHTALPELQTIVDLWNEVHRG